MTDQTMMDVLAKAPGQDEVLPFSVDALDVRGRVVHLNHSINSILARHDYPKPVARLLGQAAALTVMLAASIKLEGRLILQAQTDGPVSLLVVDMRAPGDYRATASFDADRVAELEDADAGALLGSGTLALTIDQGQYMNRYQGYVELNGGSLEDAAHDYFIRSEQIPTRIRLAVSELITRTETGEATHAWQASGVMIQFLPHASDRLVQKDLPAGGIADEDYHASQPEDDDSWVEAQALIDTLQENELADPDLSAERLLFRLFHERGVRVYDAMSVQDKCSCNAAKVGGVLGQLSREELVESIAQSGQIEVTCEFCARKYDFDPNRLLKQS
uniref:Hsp33 family molecular chaperone n=1 Tax=Pararhizobium sp. IMCC3301 TaxID=3067904 RepID=UPI002741DEB6|nr:Hsp33 family molecular chaperone [Pararhizobium sp. IMCC3301]